MAINKIDSLASGSNKLLFNRLDLQVLTEQEQSMISGGGFFGSVWGWIKEHVGYNQGMADDDSNQNIFTISGSHDLGSGAAPRSKPVNPTPMHRN